MTQTLPLAIYAQFQTGSIAVPLAMSALLVIVSGAILVTVKLLIRGRLDSAFPAETSTPGVSAVGAA